MDVNKLIERINELAKKAKEEGLTEKELQEQKHLRQEYLKNFRSHFKSHLKNIKVVDKEGNDVTPEKLKKAKLKDKLKPKQKTPVQ